MKDASPLDLSYTFEQRDAIASADSYYLGCSRRLYSSTLGGNMSLFAVYDRELTPAEVANVQELCQYWLDNGEAPEAAPLETEAKYYCVPNDPAAQLTWEVNRDGFSWVPHDTAVSEGGLSNSTTLSEHGVLNDTLHVKSATTDDNCGIRCKATTTYNQSGITTITGVLNVTEGS